MNHLEWEMNLNKFHINLLHLLMSMWMPCADSWFCLTMSHCVPDHLTVSCCHQKVHGLFVVFFFWTQLSSDRIHLLSISSQHVRERIRLVKRCNNWSCREAAWSTSSFHCSVIKEPLATQKYPKRFRLIFHEYNHSKLKWWLRVCCDTALLLLTCIVFRLSGQFCPMIVLLEIIRPNQTETQSGPSLLSGKSMVAP